MEEKGKAEVKSPYGVFNPETKKWDGAEQGINSQDYIKRRQVYGGDEWATGTGKAKELHGSDYGDAKKEWLAQGKSEEGFSANYFAGGGEGSLGGRRHKANVDRNLRAQEDEKQWRAGQAAGYEKLGEDGQRTAGIQAGNNIKKDKELYKKVMGSRGDSFGVKDLFNKMTGGGGYGGTPSTLTGEERAEMVQGLERLGVNPGSVFRDLKSKSPMKRHHDDSPFKRAPQIRRSNYTNLSEQVGSSVQGAIDERRAQERAEREEMRQAQQDEMNQMRLAKQKQAQYEELNIPADTGIKSADQYLQDASRQMVNSQSNLVNALKAGDIDTDEFAQKSALIKSQIPALQKTKEALGSFQNDYSSLLASGGISKADNGQAGQLYDLIQSGVMEIAPDEEGNMMMRSPEGYEGDPVSVPLSQISRIPKPTPKAPEMAEIIKGPLSQMDPNGGFDQNVMIKAIDGMFTGDANQDEKTLKSIAVDRLGMSLEEANELLAETDGDYGDSATNALEQRVESALLNEAKYKFNGDKIIKENNERRAALDAAKLDEYKRNIQLNEDNRIKQEEIIAQQKESQTASYDRLSRMNEFTPENIQSTFGLPTELGKDGRIQVTVGKNKVVIDPKNPNGARSVLQKALGLSSQLDPNYGQSPTTSPTKRTPFSRRMGNWFNKFTQ